MLPIGAKSGYLEILADPWRFNGRLHYLTRCVCGREKLIRVDHIEKLFVKSCGCKKVEGTTSAITTHGQSSRQLRTSEYNSWASMIQRCCNPKSQVYKHYGARGIEVCDRWKSSFENFFNDMGKKPSKELELERVDNNKGYEIGNCVWATRTQQMKNCRNTRIVDVDGAKMSVRDACALLGIPERTIYWRVCKHKVSHQKAIDDYRLKIPGGNTALGALMGGGSQ
jgi:hypothetical protein